MEERLVPMTARIYGKKDHYKKKVKDSNSTKPLSDATPTFKKN
jgi:hypothetical protein